MKSEYLKEEKCTYTPSNLRRWLLAATFAVAGVCLSSLTGATNANAQTASTTPACNTTSTSEPKEAEPLAPTLMGFFGGGNYGYLGFDMVTTLSNIMVTKVVSGSEGTVANDPNQTEKVANVRSSDVKGSPCVAVAKK
jgi:hypothetical protein